MFDGRAVGASTGASVGAALGGPFGAGVGATVGGAIGQALDDCGVCCATGSDTTDSPDVPGEAGHDRAVTTGITIPVSEAE